MVRAVRSAMVPGNFWTDGLALEQLAMLLAVEHEWKQAGELGGEEGLCNAVLDGVGHSLSCSSSLICDGGDGVFASGKIPKGRVLTVYAGAFLCSWESLIDRVFRAFFRPRGLDGYMLSQADGSVIDGSTQTASIQRQTKGYVSPSACSQLVNHPPAGRRPNSSFMTVHVPLTSAFSNLPVSPCGSRDVGPTQVATLLVSLVAIEDGEEVLVDYMMDGAALPIWYTKCEGSSKEEAKRWCGPSLKEYHDFHQISM